MLRSRDRSDNLKLSRPAAAARAESDSDIRGPGPGAGAALRPLVTEIATVTSQPRPGVLPDLPRLPATRRPRAGRPGLLGHAERRCQLEGSGSTGRSETRRHSDLPAVPAAADSDRSY